MFANRYNANKYGAGYKRYGTASLMDGINLMAGENQYIIPTMQFMSRALGFTLNVAP